MFAGDKAGEVAEMSNTTDSQRATNDNLQAALPEARQAADLSLPNTPLQECTAIFTMLLIFG